MVQKIKDIIRLKMNDVSNEKVAKALKTSKGTVHNIFKRFKASNLSWPLKEELSDSQWHEIIYPDENEVKDSRIPDWSYYETELSKPGVTIQLLFEEYEKEHHQNGLGRSVFYDRFRIWRNNKDNSMPMIHKGGDKLQVDYSGDSFYYIDKTTGELIKTELFVASWAASSYTYAEVTHSQSQEHWVASHVRAFKFFGVLPKAVIPDNLKSAIIKPSIYEPELNELYSKMAEHYDIAILPARGR
ncbi:MAG: transposase, partial [Deltaproteobacteria bacterium]|nr:transposase [Deltaproteobacteria bacterium]